MSDKACPGLVSGGFEGGARLKQIGLFEMRRLEMLSNTIFGVAMTLLNRLQHKALQSEIVATVDAGTSDDSDDHPSRPSRHHSSGGGRRHYSHGGSGGGGGGGGPDGLFGGMMGGLFGRR
jgi:hypothetical protein